MLSESARAQSEKELQKLQRELQALQEDAQQERQELTAQLQGEFQEKLNPIIEQVATEKNLQVVFSVRDLRHRLGLQRHRPLGRSHQALRRGFEGCAEEVVSINSAARAGDQIPETLERLCYRYPSPLVDAVTEHEPGRRMVAVKNVTVNEDFFQGHFPGSPVMPGVLMIETLAQVATVLLMHDSEGRTATASSCAAWTTPSSAARSRPATGCASR